MSTMPAEARQAIDELKSSVAQLVDTVRNNASPEAIERIVREVVGRSNGMGPHLRGYLPEDANEDMPGVVGVRSSLLDVGAPSRERLAMRGRERLTEILTSAPAKVANATGLPSERVREFHEISDMLVLTSAYLDRPADELELYGAFQPLARAMDTQTTAEGLEFVPRELSGSLIERINLELKVAALFPLVEMPSQPFDIPGFAVSRQRTGSHAEQTADTGQAKFKLLTPATRKITLDAKKLAARLILSKELEEDAIIAMLPFAQGELVDYLSGDLEDAILNSDTAGSHQDSDVSAADDPRKIFDGLRKRTQAAQKTDVANAAPTVANAIRINRKKMGKYGTDPRDLAHVVSISSFMQLLADSSVLTLEKYGPAATILRGELGSVDGSPLIVSEYVRQDLNASGVHDGVTTNRTVIQTVNRRGFLTGSRRAITVEVLRELYAESDQDAVVASMRRAFTGRFSTSEGVVALAYNVAT
jgi:Phage capsid family